MKKRIFAQITNQMADAVVVCNHKGEIEFVNFAFEHLTGYGADEVMGEQIHLLPLLWSEEMRAFLSSQTQTGILPAWHKDGTQRFFDLSVSPFRMGWGKREDFLILVGRDVTRQRELEEALDHARRHLEQKSKELEDLNQTLRAKVKEEIEKGMEKHRLLVQQSKMAAMGEMMGAIAHQWRQPITAIASAAMNMRMQRELGSLDDLRFGESVDSIERQTQRMSQTINNFMNFFKPSKEMQRFNLRLMLNEIYSLLSAQFVYRGVEFVNDVPRQMELCGYRNELEQVVLNLLANARDAFEEREQPQKWVRVYPSLYNQKLDLVIEDNAGGIEESLLDRVCEPYFTTKEPGRGTGIGLYMSKSIMQSSFKGDLVPKNRYCDKGKRQGALFIMEIGSDHLDCGGMPC